MEVLKDKQSKTYPSLSRYEPLNFYYHTLDNKYIYELSKSIRANTEHIKHIVIPTDTLDSLALKYYGRPDFYWIIADFNEIQDPYINIGETYRYLLIPTLNDISFQVGYR